MFIQWSQITFRQCLDSIQGRWAFFELELHFRSTNLFYAYLVVHFGCTEGSLV